MSYALLLNDRLTQDELTHLLRVEREGRMEVLAEFKKCMDSLKTPAEKKLYFDIMWPTIMQMAFGL